jgi:hypothetical protein
MEERKNRPNVRAIYVLVIAMFTIAGFLTGMYYTEKKLGRDDKITTITEYLPAERHIENLRILTDWEDPKEKLIDDLVTRPDLIPHDAVLGGKMGFYDREDIHLLNDKWILAAFEDGHIGGYMLLEFQIRDKDDIDWQVMSSYLE